MQGKKRCCLKEVAIRLLSSIHSLLDITDKSALRSDSLAVFASV